MKSISAPAMAAIEAGEAIVTGAVEIIPINSVNYTTVDTVDLNAVTNGATSATGGLTVGVELTGFDPTDIVRVSMPAGGTYVAWSPWGDPSPANCSDPDPGSRSGALHRFWVIPDGVAANVFIVGDATCHDGYEAARAAFGSRRFDGASTYEFYIQDSPVSDNSGGLSILVERGVAIGTGDPIRVWGGGGPIEIDGETYQGIGHHGLAQQTAGAVGGFAQGLQLTLSGIEPYLLEHFDGDEVKGASVVIRRLIFGPDGKTLLDASVWDRGRVDTAETSETIGGSAAIVLAVETAARGLGSSGARQRSDSDQRLINPNDGYFKNTAFAGQKKLYWGGRRPVSAGGSTRMTTTEFRDFFLGRSS